MHMADGWGRLTEQPGVALLTAGPGHCNAISALYGALMAESPMVLLSGHAPHAQIGSGAFQEIDQVAAAKPVTKAAWLVEDPNHLDEAITTALSLACEGRPGPVHLSLPTDVLEATVSPQSLQGTAKDAASIGVASASEVDDILCQLTEAEHPAYLGRTRYGTLLAMDGGRTAIRSNRYPRPSNGKPTRSQRPVAASGDKLLEQSRPCVIGG